MHPHYIFCLSCNRKKKVLSGQVKILGSKRTLIGVTSLTEFQASIKVLSILETYFDLISGSSLSMKIQIMGGKITENLVFKSPLRRSKFLQIRYQKMEKKDIHFGVKNLKMKRKKNKKI